MEEYTFFDPSSGEILFNYSGYNLQGMLDEMPSSSFIDGTYDYNQKYFLNNSPTDRPIMTISLNKASILADGIDTLTISSIPEGAILRIKGETFFVEEIVSGGIETFLTNSTGNYIIEVEKFPYITFKGTFNAT